jgi:hypothetical protein
MYAPRAEIGAESVKWHVVALCGVSGLAYTKTCGVFRGIAHAKCPTFNVRHLAPQLQYWVSLKNATPTAGG